MKKDFWELMKEKVEKKVSDRAFPNLVAKEKYISDAAHKTILRIIEGERCLGVKALGDSEREIGTLIKVAKEDSSEQVRSTAVYELSFYKDLLEVWNVIINIFFNDSSCVVMEEAERCLLRVRPKREGGRNG